MLSVVVTVVFRQPEQSHYQSHTMVMFIAGIN